MNTGNLSEQEIIRREKLAELQQLGVDPFPAALYPVSHYSADILKRFAEENKEEFSEVTLAGRVMSINDKGKVVFIKIQDSHPTLCTQGRFVSR
jgi:lysyl-tRNA synthetase class 2